MNYKKGETSMKKLLGVFVAMVFFSSVLCVAQGYAEESTSTSTLSLKEQLEADKAAIQAQKEEMKTNSQAAKSEEKALKEQIRAARASGDTAKVKELQSQLKTTHKENVQERRQDKKEMHGAKKELKKDRHAARVTKKR
jgi:hypothetical protein